MADGLRDLGFGVGATELGFGRELGAPRPAARRWSQTCSGLCGEDRPRRWDAFELVFPACFVCEGGTDGEVADGGGDEDLAWLRGCLDALGDHDREAGDVVGSQFDLAGVKPSADRDAELLGASADGSRAFDRAGWDRRRWPRCRRPSS